MWSMLLLVVTARLVAVTLAGQLEAGDHGGVVGAGLAELLPWVLGDGPQPPGGHRGGDLGGW